MHLWKGGQKVGQGPPATFGQNPKEKQFFFGNPSLIYSDKVCEWIVAQLPPNNHCYQRHANLGLENGSDD